MGKFSFMFYNISKNYFIWPVCCNFAFNNGRVFDAIDLILFIMEKLISELNSNIQKYLNSDDDWFKSNFEIDEASDWTEFTDIVTTFCDKIPTPSGHKRRKEMDKLTFIGTNSWMTINFKWIIPENMPKQVISIDGVYTISCL